LIQGEQADGRKARARGDEKSNSLEPNNQKNRYEGEDAEKTRLKVALYQVSPQDRHYKTSYLD